MKYATPFDAEKDIDGGGYVTNGDRAERADGVIECYVNTEEGYRRDEVSDDHIADLLCDLQHYCHREKLDFDDLLRRGRAMFHDESETEPQPDAHEIVAEAAELASCWLFNKRNKAPNVFSAAEIEQKLNEALTKGKAVQS